MVFEKFTRNLPRNPFVAPDFAGTIRGIKSSTELEF
jgi:hypothetical protein